MDNEIKIGSIFDYQVNDKVIGPEKLKVLKDEKHKRDIEKTINCFYDEVNRDLMHNCVGDDQFEVWKFWPSYDLRTQLRYNQKAIELIIIEYKKAGWDDVIFIDDAQNVKFMIKKEKI